MLTIIILVIAIYAIWKWICWKWISMIMIAYVHENNISKIDELTFDRLSTWIIHNRNDDIFNIDGHRTSIFNQLQAFFKHKQEH